MAYSSRPAGNQRNSNPIATSMPSAMNTEPGIPANLRTRQIQPGLGHLVGANLAAAGIGDVHSAIEEQRPQRNDDRGDTANGYDQPVDKTANHTEAAGKPNSGKHAEVGIDAQEVGGHISCQADDGGDREIDVAGDHDDQLTSCHNRQQRCVERQCGKVRATH